MPILALDDAMLGLLTSLVLNLSTLHLLSVRMYYAFCLFNLGIAQEGAPTAMTNMLSLST
jgi:hypothetical protein